ncbi:cytochrome c nitrite reductase subunit NrfD [Paraferrimonas sedimenticola]|uniref:Cytochrome c nitrite reductase subunit NrfD n=1 Tax=Paraferrimonas sedimenticola TaxID=375674 RepID=A0AA37RV70_9GAMM|nr:cytochrome c nitrite reductase subunit NrfD [Paraferrimonas sedimenticola]GLP95432.1 cytochrome c nitrite reductase subunit NrfD [Paraferrimonas sedimenticola]
MSEALHFDSLVWHWPIAWYLFLAGVSAGAVTFAIFLKHIKLGWAAYRSPYFQAAAIIAPISIFLGLGILVVDLTKPLEFWKILVFYNPRSVMSMGVLVLMVYQLVLFLWLGCAFQQPIMEWVEQRAPKLQPWLERLWRFEAAYTGVLVILAVSLGAYTGFLLSALVGYPMLSNPVLPLLFLISGLSSGAAAVLLGGIWLKGQPDAAEVRFIHGIEIPLILLEIVMLFTFFSGLILSGGRSEVAAMQALGPGFWGVVFWVGIVSLGMVLPLFANLIMGATAKRTVRYVAMTASFSLLGVLLLRHFVLYAGQMTVA